MSDDLSHPLPVQHLQARLLHAGIQPTRQRLAIAQVLLHTPVHLSADEVMAAARAHCHQLSRATVYNTLTLFVEKGLLRALRLDTERTLYDSRTESHSHIYYEDTGTVEDLPYAALQLPQLAPELEILALDLIVRVRQRSMACKA